MLTASETSGTGPIAPRPQAACAEVQGPGSWQQQSHKHAPVRASFPAHKDHMEFLVKSYQTGVRAGAVQPAPRRTARAEGVSTATLTFGHHSCTEAWTPDLPLLRTSGVLAVLHSGCSHRQGRPTGTALPPRSGSHR